jgi:hypothetical protein
VSLLTCPWAQQLSWHILADFLYDKAVMLREMIKGTLYIKLFHADWFNSVDLAVLVMLAVLLWDPL